MIHMRNMTARQFGLPFAGFWWALFIFAFTQASFGAITPKMGVQFNQVDFNFEKTPWANSTWGQLSVDIQFLAESTRIQNGYLNVFSPLGWHVVNMPITIDDAKADPYAIAYFNLGLGDQAAIAKLSPAELQRYLLEISTQLKEFSANVTFTEEPLKEIPRGEYITFPMGNSVSWNSQGASEMEVAAISFPPAILSAWKHDFSIRDFVYTQDHSINVQTAYNQCFPMAIANSLQYLEDVFGLPIPSDHTMGLYGDNSLVGLLDSAAGRKAESRTYGPGTWFTPMVKGKFAYLDRRQLSGLLEQTYQGRGWGKAPDQALPAGDYTIYGNTLVDKGDRVTWEWIVQQIRDGEDVELVFSYDNASGEPTGGHAVRVFECGTIGGKPYIKYLHDRNQYSDSDGLETVQVFLEDLDGDGMLNLGSVSREIRFAMSESIKVKPTPTPIEERPTPTNTFQTEPSPTSTKIEERPTPTNTVKIEDRPTPHYTLITEPTPTDTPTPREVIEKPTSTPTATPTRPNLGNGLRPDDGIHFCQVNFLFEQAQWLNSGWGRIEVNPIILYERTKIRSGFLNVYSEKGWHIINMPIAQATQTATGALSSTLSSYFNFGLIDPNDMINMQSEELFAYLRERSVRFTEFKVFIAFTEEPLQQYWQGEWISFPLDCEVVWDAQGVSDASISIYSFPPSLVKIEDIIVAALSESYIEPQSINVETAYNQCFPMAIANSLQYLENQFGLPVPHNHVMGLKGDNSLVGQLDAYGNRSVTDRRHGSGMWFTPMLNGKFKYLSDNGLTGALVHKYQGRGWGSTPNQALPPGDFTAYGSTAKDEGSVVTYEWIKQQMIDGEDVELIFSYDNASGNPTGGHAVRVFECGKILGKPYVKYLHDRNQSNDSDGLETVQVYIDDLDGDGLPNLGSANREIRFALSESAIHQEPTATSTPRQPTPTSIIIYPVTSTPRETIPPTATPFIIKPSPTPTKGAIVGPVVYDDLVVSQGYGGQTLVNIRFFNTLTNAFSSIRRSFSALPPIFQERIGGGQGRATYLATGDLDGDGTPDIVTSFSPILSESTYPNILIVRDSETKRVIGGAFTAFPTGDGTSASQYNGGEIRAAVGNFLGSDLPQLAVVQGYGGNGIVRLYRYTNKLPPNSWEAVGQFNGLPAALVSQTSNLATAVLKVNIGLTLAAGDLDGDGLDELVVGQTNGPQSQTIFHVLDITAKGGIENRYTYAGFAQKFRGNGGIELAVGDLNNDGLPEIIVGSMGNLKNFGDTRDTAQINLVGVISPIVVDQKITGFKRPTGRSVFNAYTQEINPSGAVTLGVGEFDGNPSNGDEVAVGTSAFMQFGAMSTTFQLAPTDPRYKFFKIDFDGTAVNNVNVIGPANGYVAFIGRAVPESKTVFLAGLRPWKPEAISTPTPTSTPTFTPTPTEDVTPGIQRCVTAGDYYRGEASELSSINMGYVKITSARAVTGAPVHLNVTDCSGDGALDVQIPWTEANAAQLAAIEFSANLCRGAAPKRVEIVLKHGTPIKLRAYDDTGAQVDTVSSESTDIETLTLTSASGVRVIKIEGAEICILKICWLCALIDVTPSPTPTEVENPGVTNCVTAGDYYRGEASDLSSINMGYVQITEAQTATGAPIHLSVTDCSGDGYLDVQIPWSEATAAQRATIEFSSNVCRGAAPQKVEIVLKHGTPIKLTAYDDTGAQVDTVSSESSDVETLTLASASGIRVIEIEGAEICILKICWQCLLIDVTPRPTATHPPEYSPTPTIAPGSDNCVSADKYYKEEGEYFVVTLGGVEILPAVDPTGKAVPLRVVNCSYDTTDLLDLFVSWSGETASPKASINFSKDLCDGNLPSTVIILLKQDSSSTFYAYDSSNILVDTQSATASTTPQYLTFKSPSRISRIEIAGAEICIMKICWGCQAIEVRPTPSVHKTWLSFDEKAEKGSPVTIEVGKSTEDATMLRYHIPGVWQSTVQYGGKQFTRIEFPEVGVLAGAGFESGEEWFQFPKEANYPPLDGERYRNALSVRISRPAFPEQLDRLTDLPRTAEAMQRLGVDPAGARPGIPVLAGLLAVNPLASRSEINIVTVTLSAKELKLDNPLVPAGYSGLDQATNEQVGTTPPELIDQDFYEGFKDVYTGPENNFSDISRSGAFSVVEMRTPLLSAHTASAIQIFTDIEIKINHPGGVKRKSLIEETHTIPWDTWVNKPAVINGWTLRKSLLESGISILPIRLARYLILTPSGYTAYLNSFVDWKKSKGLAVDVKTVGTAGIADVAADRNAIDQYIEDYYYKYSWATVYVLIIGDQDLVPAGRTSKVVTSPDYSDADSDHVYSVIGADRFTSVYVGRLSVNGMPSELEAQLNKIMSYERGDVAGRWPRIATLLANSQNNDESLGVSSSFPSKYAAAINEIASYPSYSNPPTFEVMHAGAANNTTPRAVNQNVIDALKAGRGQLLYRGHGGSSSWVKGWDGSSDYGNAFDSSEELPLVSNTVFPIIYSIACQNNRIKTDDSFGESWMSLNNAGASAFWGASVNSYTTENHNRAKGVFRAIYESNETRLGPALADAEQISWGLTGDSTSWDSNSFCYLLLGDPEMTIRRHWILSQKFKISWDKLRSGISIKLADENGTPIPGALVSVQLNQQNFVNGFTNNNGSLVIQDIDPKAISRFDVFSHKHPWLRYIPEISPEIETTLPDPIWVDVNNGSGVENGSELYPFNSIAEAMVQASTHTIRVRSGYYTENVVMKNGVKLIGAGADTTIIEGSAGAGISCIDVGAGSLITGFRIQNSSVGISCNASSPMIRENVITHIAVDSLTGDGIRLSDSSPIIKNNLIYDVGGMGIAGSGASEPTIINNTIYNYCYYAGISFAALNIGAVSPIVKNNIIVRGNDKPVAGVLWRLPASVQVSYNDIYDVGNVTMGTGPSYYSEHDGTQWHDVSGGEGAIQENPLFEDAGNNVFNLLYESPCIDAGDPNPIYNDANGTRNDMGAYGGQRMETGNSSHPGTGFLFTSIGRIPIDEIDRDSASPSYGLAVVSATAAADYSIPQYKDSPFGGVLWIRGLFGVHDPVDYYQILVRPATSTVSTPLNDPLVKTNYVINGDGTVTQTTVHLGPQTIGGVSNLYQLNKEGIWNFEDVRMIWNTAGLNGKYVLEYRAYRQTAPGVVEEVDLDDNDNDHLTLWLDNTPLDVKINEILYANGTGLVECEGIKFPHAGSSQLIFDITANHPTGFLRYMVLDCYWGHDQYGGRFLYEQYEGMHDAAPPLWDGYLNEALPPLSPLDGAGNVVPWQNCAYRFRLYAEGRATDGYTYLHGASSNFYHDVEVLSLAAKQAQPQNAVAPACADEETNSPLLTMLLPLNPVAAPPLSTVKNTPSAKSVSPMAGEPLTADDFVDTWINIDSATLGITHIKIDRSGGNMIVQAFGKCHPTDCDWGAVTVPYTGNPFTAIYEPGFKTTTLTITLLDKNTLTVHSLNVFHDGSGRDYTSDYTFRGSTVWVDDSNTTGVEDGTMQHPFNTIPEGIIAALSGQIVHVLPGLYTLPVVMKNGVSLIGSGADQTIIDLGGSGTGVYCSGIGSKATLAGFKITNAVTGVYCQSSNLAIRENTIANIAYTSLAGDGIRLDNSSPIIRNNLIFHVGGMGIRAQGNSEPKIINNTIYDYGYYAGISFAALNIGAVSPVIKNNIIVRGNAQPVGGILWSAPSSPIVSYNDVFGVGNVTGTGSVYAYHNGTQWVEQSGGTGAISTDPLFVDAAHGFFYLDAISPCVDAGDPDAAYNDNDGSRNDMGAYGGLRLENSAPFHATNGFVFTAIGKVPLTEIVKDTSDPCHGLLRVSDEAVANYSIPKYTDAAFGGVLWLHGLFGSSDDVDYYQICATPYGTSATAALSEPLAKTFYTINPDGSVTSTRVKMGPLTVGGVENVYLLNKAGYWSFTDLRYIWNTTGLHGKYNITVKAYRLVADDTLEEVILPSNDLDHFTLRVNNQPPEVNIDSITYADETSIEECEKIHFPHNGNSSLIFTLTAWHPEGFMREFSLNAYWGNDRFGGLFIADRYVGSNDGAPPVWQGWKDHTFPAMLPKDSAGNVMPWHSCAYRFSLVGTTRITDGIQYIHWRNDNIYQTVVTTP